MRVAAGSLYVGCQDQPVSARVGNFGCWGPGLGGESRSALLVWGALSRDIARGDGTGALVGQVSLQLLSWTCSTLCGERSYC